MQAPLKKESEAKRGEKFKKEVEVIAPKANPHNSNWHPGNAPSAGFGMGNKGNRQSQDIIYYRRLPTTMQYFPIGQAMNKNVRINVGNCNHQNTYLYC